MAYTYLIGWSNHDQYYYGVRYAQNCDPRTDNMSIVTDVEYDRIANLAERVEYTRGKTWEDLYTPEQIERRLASAKEAGAKKRGVSTPKKADRSKYKQAANARWQDESKRAAYKSRKHMNKNGQRKFALPDEQQALLSEGWSYGRG